MQKNSDNYILLYFDNHSAQTVVKNLSITVAGILLIAMKNAKK